MIFHSDFLNKTNTSDFKARFLQVRLQKAP